MRQKAPIVGSADDPAILDAVSDILTGGGDTVERATNGTEGLHLLEHLEPRLVRLDMRMTVLDGWGFVRTVRQQDRGRSLVVMTAVQDAQRWAQEIAANSYLAEPFELLDLRDVVEHSGG